MTTAGFMSVSVTDGAGKQITQFDPPIPLSVEVPSTTVNQRAGRTIQNGDQIQVFSFSKNLGVWIEEGEVSVSGPNASGNYAATFLTNHLSTWNVGYSDNGCSSGAFTINRNGNTGPLPVTIRASDNSWYSSVGSIPAGESSLRVTNAPANLPGYVIEFPGNGNAELIGAGSICGSSGTVSLPAPSANVIDTTFTLDFGTTCTALRVTSIGTYTLNYRKEGASAASSRNILVDDSNMTKDSLQRITGGSLTIPALEQGSTYVFSTTFDNDVTTRSKTITGPTMVLDISDDLDGDICAAQ